MRNYNEKLIEDIDNDIYTVDEWLKNVKNICCCNYDGSGYWIKDGFICEEDEVFSSEPLDATHVIWYNK